MTVFRIADMDVHWSGVDDTTPAGCCAALGIDPLGNVRVWLFRGETPADDRFLGSLLIPRRENGIVTAHGPTGAYVASSGTQADLLVRLAAES
jgi:hypothetical protein